METNWFIDVLIDQYENEDTVKVKYCFVRGQDSIRLLAVEAITESKSEYLHEDIIEAICQHQGTRVDCDFEIKRTLP